MITASADLLVELPLSQACALLGLARGAHYRHGQQRAERTECTTGTARRGDRELLEAIEAILLAFPGYGYPRVTAQLQRDGWAVNHKRVHRVMAEADLLQRRPRRGVRTTQSENGLPVYPNLLSGCGWRQLTAPDQAWAADLTYVRLWEGFCYLAVILDLFSRRVVGWGLGRTLEATVALTALEQALAWRQPPAGWIHHSDRGVQYACGDYVHRLRAAEARISMTRVGAPRENAPTERLIRTVKEEEVALQEYHSFTEAERSLGRFIEDVYNTKRLHSALGYRPPSEFEEMFTAGLVH